MTALLKDVCMLQMKDNIQTLFLASHFKDLGLKANYLKHYTVMLEGQRKIEALHETKQSGFPTMCDTNRLVQSQKHARSLISDLRKREIVDLCKVAPVAEWLRSLTSVLLIIRSSHRCGFAPGSGRESHVGQAKFCLRVCQVVFPRVLRFSPHLPIDPSRYE